ncbi:glyoxylate/hydroxypyruvate reductase A [Ruegeria sp.]|uniref:2-hydroxyacid dehydrogenase n=1 Tax=Ruegeria sp. TaxID=1879320 RepID=UPI00230AA006|nr:glyoxylate/hydroxypyruvate reductase A [Ruegeria sp.]MDA7965566.1 glyoxylate/hydroxypyruvate reductase A [Ruegeria sp.]
MAIFFHWDEASTELWQAAFKEAGIEADLRSADNLGNVEDIEYAIVWAAPHGLMGTFPNLKYIFSVGAGVTHITADPDAPLHVPIVRLQDDMLVLDMSCHIIHWVLHFHRYYYRYRQYEADKTWLRHRYPDNSDKRVAIMGLGQTGQDACRRLHDLGFDVTGWARSPKEIPGVRCLHGEDQFAELLAGADILVNLLPLTPQTENILNAQTLAQMPDGAFVINCSRGASINDADLLAALDSGKIEAAALDVFRTEPLPQDDPYWEHPNVFVTPHAAAPSNERSAAGFIVGNIKKCLDGGVPAPIVDLDRGY